MEGVSLVVPVADYDFHCDRLQFYPKTSFSASSVQYTGRFKMKFAVQQRVLRHEHQDAHYANSIFCYLKAFAVKFKQFTTFIFVDDKVNRVLFVFPFGQGCFIDAR